MDSFLKDALSALVLAGWVFPVVYLTLALVAGKVMALFRHLAGRRDQTPPARSRRARPVAASPTVSPVSARRAPVAAVGMSAPVARVARPRVASRWKGNHRLSAGTC